MCALCSIAKLKMLEEEGKLVKVAHTMVAKDGEVWGESNIAKINFCLSWFPLSTTASSLDKLKSG